jgi:hypothetical protein
VLSLGCGVDVVKRWTAFVAVVSALLVSPLGGTAVPVGAVDGSHGTATSSASAQCSVRRLPLPSGRHRGLVTGGDPSGRYLIGRTVTGAALLWHDGELIEGPEPPGTIATYPSDVNGAGVLVGGSVEDSGMHAWRYRYADGAFTWLPEPANALNTRAWAVNSRGDVVGVATNDDGASAVYWPASEPGTVHVLRGPDVSTAIDIADNGVVLGIWYGGGGRGYVWEDPDRTGRRLLGSTGGTGTFPHVLRGHMIVGRDSPNPDGTEGARWNLRTGQITTYEAEVQAVNSRGDLVSVRTWPAVIVRANGGTTELASLDGNRPRHAEVLFEPGSDLVAGGWATNENRRKQPVVWPHCRPDDRTIDGWVDRFARPQPIQLRLDISS